ncbi:MAG: tetratricopeptide repeat protein [Ferruginibacter sp.]
MRKISLLFSLSCIAILTASAQRELSNPLIDSKELISKAVALHNEGKYKAAIAEYAKIPESDTSYADALYEMILSNYKDSNYVTAEKLVHKGFSMFPERSNDWYGSLADIYDDNGKTAEALKIYDTLLIRRPYNYLTWFNKGISLFRLSKMDEAIASFQQCIMINPYYSSAHYFLGRSMLVKGDLARAMMSFAGNLLVSPGNNYYKYSIGYLNSIAEVNSTVTEFLPKYKPGKDDDFETIQEIITSKAAMDSRYKLKAGLEDQVVRQLQVMLEKLEYNANDKGFWMQYYVPLYKSIWDNGQFEALVNYMFSELEIKSVKEYNRKEKKSIQAMTNAVVTYMNSIRESHVLRYPDREKATERYYLKEYTVTGKGAYGKNAKNEDIVTGPWEFFHSNGMLKSKGNFDGNGGRTGEWKFYYENGEMNEVSSYQNDKANGKSESWYDNGIHYRLGNYINDGLDGEVTDYFYNGMLKSVTKYKDGKKEGTAKFYTVTGYLKTVTQYSNDVQEGEELTYHHNGKLESKLNYTKDVANGEYAEYFNDGKIRVTGTYTDGKKTGAWKTWYKNGKQEYLENYVKGELDGEYISWYKNGQVESRRLYIKGEVDGKKEDFDDDGKIYSESIFEKGRLRDIKFFDKTGTVISSTTSRKGNADITFYAPDGSKNSDGYYTKEGLLEGKGNYYYKNGQPSTEAFYKKGLLDGKRILYYENGKLKQEGSFTENEANGYFTDFYPDGEISEEGWYVKGRRQGTVISKNQLGTVTSKVYYLDNEVHGVSEYYYSSGKLDYKAFYDNGWFYRAEQYDTLGNVLSDSKLVKGEGKIIYKHFNGKTYIESNYKNYKLNGVHTVTNGDGSKSSIGYYKNGEEDSTYISWYPGGKVKQEGRYDFGKKTGVWKYYYPNGQLSSQETYENGEMTGKNIQYNEDGTIDKEMNYKEGELDGELKVYADNKQLAIVYFYKEGTFSGYSYEDKEGKLLPAIPVLKGSAKIVAYFKNGNKSVEMEYKTYMVDGPRNLYYSNGKEYVTGQRVNGDDNGTKKIFYPSGKIWKEENYRYGKLHGRAKLYNENGTLVYDLNYYLGDLHGECKYFTTAGKPETYIYYYGALESKK